MNLPIQKRKQNSYLGNKEFDEHEIINIFVFKTISYDWKPHTNFFYKRLAIKTCQIYDLLSFS